MLHDVEAVVLVGGKGTRLRPLYAVGTQADALPTAGVPFLAHLAVPYPVGRRPTGGAGHLHSGAETLAEHFGDGSALGLEIEYVVEDEPLGEAAASGTWPST